MRRLWRLLAPAVVSLLLTFTLLGWLQDLGDDPAGALRRGLLGLGLHALALHLAVSTFLIVAIDDLTRGAGWASRRSTGKQHGWFEIATCPVRLPVALARFYSRPALPVFLLSLGLGLPLSAVVHGALGEQGAGTHDLFGLPVWRSWSVAFPLLLVAALLLLRAGTARAALGLVWGLSLSFALGEPVYSGYGAGAPAIPGTDAWEYSVFALSAVVLVLGLLRRLRARRRAGTAEPPRVRATASVS